MKSKLIIVVMCLCTFLLGIVCGRLSLGNENTIEANKTQIAENTESANEQANKDDNSTISDETIAETPSPTESIEDRVEKYLEQMSIEEKVAQLFVILPEALVNVDVVTAAGQTTKAAFDEIPVSGFIYMENNLYSKDQVQTMLSNVQEFSMERIGLPAFTCVDEEGGTVLRIGGSGNFDVPYIGNMSEIGASGDTQLALNAGNTIGEYLSELGFNLDFAPVSDVLSNPYNQVVRYRSFGSDPNMTADMSMAFIEGLHNNGVLGSLKHYPGHGSTEGDTHAGYAYTSKTLEELQTNELVPFQRGIEEGVEVIMVGHISLPNIIGDDTPASLSSTMLQQILREQMGFDGIVITDAMNMGAISQNYSSSNAAVTALQAGADIILMPADFHSAYYGVLNALENQTISYERIDESLRRIIRVKLELLESEN